MQHPQNLQEAYAMAKLHDTIIQSQGRPHLHGRSSFPPGKQYPTTMGNIGSNVLDSRAALHKPVNAGNYAINAGNYASNAGNYVRNAGNYASGNAGQYVVKTFGENMGTKLTINKEMKARMAKGLCYWCPERYTAGHGCKGKHIFLIEVRAEEVNETELE